MAKDLTVKTVDNPALWDDFVALSPQGTVFSTTRWLKTAAGVQGSKPEILGVWNNDTLVAGVSYVSLSRGPFTKATSPVITPYGGVLCRPDPGKRSSEAESFNLSCMEMCAQELRLRYNHTFLVHSPHMTDIRPFIWAGWNDKVRYTYLLDISDPEKLWDILERRVRTVIRNAESSLTLGGEVDNGEFAKLYMRIYTDRGVKPPFSLSMVTKMVSEIVGSGLGEMRSVCDSGGKLISTMVLVHDDRCVYAWLSGSLPGENASGAFSLLFWDAVKRYSQTHSLLDMVGANIRPIAFFKKGFGGKLTPYYVTERYSSFSSKLAFKAYSALKRHM